MTDHIVTALCEPSRRNGIFRDCIQLLSIDPDSPPDNIPHQVIGDPRTANLEQDLPGLLRNFTQIYDHKLIGKGLDEPIYLIHCIGQYP